MILAAAGVAAAWLFFSVLKHLIGFLAIGAVIAIGFVVLTRPEVIEIAKTLWARG